MQKLLLRCSVAGLLDNLTGVRIRRSSDVLTDLTTATITKETTTIPQDKLRNVKHAAGGRRIQIVIERLYAEIREADAFWLSYDSTDEKALVSLIYYKVERI